MVKQFLVFVAVAMLSGCGVLTNPNTPANAVLTGEAVVCAIDHSKDPIPTIITECNIAQVFENDIGEIVTAAIAQQKAAAAAPCSK